MDVQLVEAIVREWQRQHPEWVNPPAPRSPWQFLGGVITVIVGLVILFY